MDCLNFIKTDDHNKKYVNISFTFSAPNKHSNNVFSIVLGALIYPVDHIVMRIFHLKYNPL
jgi:hypothetical protein